MAGRAPPLQESTPKPSWKILSFSIVCRTAETRPQSSPFMCMDLTYISLLLQEFGFPESKVLKVRALLRGLPGLCHFPTLLRPTSMPATPEFLCPFPLSFLANSENQQRRDQLGFGSYFSLHRHSEQTEEPRLIAATINPLSSAGDFISLRTGFPVGGLLGVGKSHSPAPHPALPHTCLSSGWTTGVGDTAPHSPSSRLQNSCAVCSHEGTLAVSPLYLSLLSDHPNHTVQTLPPLQE